MNLSRYNKIYYFLVKYGRYPSVEYNRLKVSFINLPGTIFVTTLQWLQIKSIVELQKYHIYLWFGSSKASIIITTSPYCVELNETSIIIDFQTYLIYPDSNKQKMNTVNTKYHIAVNPL